LRCCVRFREVDGGVPMTALGAEPPDGIGRRPIVFGRWDDLLLPFTERLPNGAT
jgi:hypothetical protein